MSGWGSFRSALVDSGVWQRRPIGSCDRASVEVGQGPTQCGEPTGNRPLGEVDDDDDGNYELAEQA